MLRNLLVPVLIVVGALLVFSVLLKETDAPKGTFDLTNAHLTWLMDRTDLTILLEENGPRDVPDGVTACYASRTVDFKKAGSATIEQTCTDEEQRQFTDSGEATWSVDDDTLCLDMRPLDRDPGCWAITYRDGTLEFKNEAKTIRWFGRVFSSDTDSLEHLVNSMTQN
jgi:hypothetical protein